MAKTTARDVLLVAALDLSKDHEAEFTEWELTIAAWKRDPKRFGMRGHEEYPDHKRVYMEYVGRKNYNPIFSGLMEKTKPNTYRLTPLGRAEAMRLAGGQTSNAVEDRYDLMAGFVHHSAFLAWIDDCESPKRAYDYADFKRAKTEGDIDHAVRETIRWMDENGLTRITKAPISLCKPITHNELVCVLDFLHAMKLRFPKLAAAS